MKAAFELREFECKHCGHKVVVNPRLPLDYTPNVCAQCWQKIVVPEQATRMRALTIDIIRFARRVEAVPKRPEKRKRP